MGIAPWGVAIAPNGATAYVTNSGSNTVTPIDTATNTPGTPIAVGTAPAGIAIALVSAPPPSTLGSGYDLVGRDGGVFVFPTSSNTYYGSLPGLGIQVTNIVGMEPTNNDHGYDLVGI